MTPENRPSRPYEWHSDAALCRMLGFLTAQVEKHGMEADRVATEMHTRGLLEELPQRLRPEIAE